MKEYRTDFITSIVHRLSHWVCWLAFIVFNLLLITLFLLICWVYQIDSAFIVNQLHIMVSYHQFSAIWQMLSFWGLSGAAIFAAYLWLWHKIYWAFAEPYLFKGVNIIREHEANGSYPP